jgi:hypothetical protein
MNLEVEFFAGSESTKNQSELELEDLGRFGCSTIHCSNIWKLIDNLPVGAKIVRSTGIS